MDAINVPGFRHEMQEGRIERPIGRRFILAFGGFVAAGLMVVTGRLIELQLVRGQDLAEQARANKTYPILISPPRGIFYDRNHKPLVENAPTFVISLSPALSPSDEAFGEVLGRLTAILGESIGELAEANGVRAEYADGEELLVRSAWPDEVFAASGELRTAVLEIKSRPDDFPGVSAVEAGRRQYILGDLSSHLLGYVGRPSREDLENRPGVRSSDIIGKSGLELWYESAVRGRAGEKLMEVNASGEVKRERFIVKAAPGQDVVLEIDAGLQRFAAATLERHLKALGRRAGAILAVDPRDGAVRALASFPSFDPNLFGRGSPPEELERLLNDPASPFFNRAVSGGYPSGSTIKPILAAAALEENIIAPERQIYDPGYLSVPNPFDPARPTIYKDWKELGWVDMRDAIALSANVYFYTIGGGHRDIRGLGIERIKIWLERFGWGRRAGIDLPGEYGGLIPDPESKKIIRPQDPLWRIGDTYITAIGQGDLQATPLQLAMSTAAIANGGTLWKPRLAKAVIGEDGVITQGLPSQAIAVNLASPESLRVVREGMRQAVSAGSAVALNDMPIAVAGKTGTAQTGAYSKNHGWFIGFAPYENPEIVIVVLVEEGTGGSTDAVPIAKEVLYYYFTAIRNAQLTATE